MVAERHLFGTGSMAGGLLTMIAVLAATAQAFLMWQGRNAHIELNLHSEQLRACARVASRSAQMFEASGDLIEARLGLPSGQTSSADHIEARKALAEVRRDLFDELTRLELFSNGEVQRVAAALGHDLQAYLNELPELASTSDERFRDRKSHLSSQLRLLFEACRQELSPTTGRR